MKKSFPTNINGKIFYIDEDAYTLLQNYLSQLHSAFGGSEGEEIVSDIEARISELFDEKLSSGVSVIVLSDVNNIIETMGRPEDISESAEDTEEPKAADNPECEADRQPISAINIPAHKRIFRNMQDKVFGGVIGGLAAYLGWDSTIMRILFVVLVFASAPFIKMWPFIILYLLAWMIIQPARTPRQILEMHGSPVNVDTIGQTVLSTSPTTPPPYTGNGNSTGNFFSTIASVFAKCIIAFLGLVGGLVTIGCVVAILVFASALISNGFFDYDSVLRGLDVPTFQGTYIAWLVIVWCFAGLIPALALVWTAACVLFNTAGASRPVVISALILEALLIAAGVTLAIVFHAENIAYHELAFLVPTVGTTISSQLACA